nr:Chain A, Exendin-4, Alpha/kappa-conotoxin pl14a chimera [unidentified]
HGEGTFTSDLSKQMEEEAVRCFIECLKGIGHKYPFCHCR